MKKKLLSMILMTALCLLAACGTTETIDGTWELKQQRFADGTVLKGDDVGAYECYEISGDKASYTCKGEGIGERNMEFQVEPLGENEYNIKMTDTLVFVTGKLDGKTFSYTIGEGEDAVEFIFEKK